ncbi:MAG: nucleoside/nucleotide kinase family protein [Rubrimonas sp.]|uniref:nucleoside/nucleotide kinase family protein n=1 Tax=Rubrimonas sp. TaxID=2036015 RepID=UPI002FDE3F32
MSDPTLSPEAFADALARRVGEGRLIAALAGPPGAGKSTLAEAVAARLNAARPDLCAILPMDGFHYDDQLLGPRGWRARKGAPHTFDVGGLAATLRRLRENAEDEVAVPVFDRGLEIARAGARLIPRQTPVILVEGNYLLLDAAPWRDLRPLFDVTAAIRVERATLQARLRARWLGLGLSEAETDAKLAGNDLPNADLVLGASAAPDFWVDGGV